MPLSSTTSRTSARLLGRGARFAGEVTEPAYPRDRQEVRHAEDPRPNPRLGCPRGAGRELTTVVASVARSLRDEVINAPMLTSPVQSSALDQSDVPHQRARWMSDPFEAHESDLPTSVPGLIVACTRGFPGGPGRTTNPTDFTSLMDDLEERIFGRLDDDTCSTPGTGRTAPSSSSGHTSGSGA